MYSCKSRLEAGEQKKMILHRLYFRIGSKLEANRRGLDVKGANYVYHWRIIIFFRNVIYLKNFDKKNVQI